MFRCQEYACDNIEHIIGAITQCNAGRVELVLPRETFGQLVTTAIGVTAQALDSGTGCSNGQWARTLRIFIGSQFDGIADTVFAFQLLHRLAGLVGLQGAHPGCGHIQKTVD